MSFTGFAVVEVFVDGKWHLACDKEDNEIYFEKYGQLAGYYRTSFEELDFIPFYTVNEPGTNGEIELIPSERVLRMFETNEQEFIETGGESLWKEYSFSMYKLSSFLAWLNYYLKEETPNKIQADKAFNYPNINIIPISRIIGKIIKQVDEAGRKYHEDFDYERDVRIIALSGFY